MSLWGKKTPKQLENVSHAEMIYQILPVCAIKSIYGHMKMATAEV